MERDGELAKSSKLPIMCQYCGTEGHDLDKCGLLTEALQKWTMNQPCSHCGQLGHDRLSCPLYSLAKKKLGDTEPVTLNQRMAQLPKPGNDKSDTQDSGGVSDISAQTCANDDQCHYCGMRGHKLEQCETMTDALNHWTQHPLNTACDHCGRSGHSREKCRYYLAAKDRLGGQEPISLIENATRFWKLSCPRI